MRTYANAARTHWTPAPFLPPRRAVSEPAAVHTAYSGFDFGNVRVFADAKSTTGEYPEDGDAIVDDKGPAATPLPGVEEPSAPLPTTPSPPTTADVPPPVTAAFGSPSIRAASTPASMADRIPPRVDTPVSVTIAGATAGMTPVVVSATGTGGGNGDLTVDGGASASLNSTRTVQLRGTTQTTPGKGGMLRLVATQGATTLATSNSFTVSAIPQNYSDTFLSLITGTSRGIIVQDDWESDSGTFADLDQTKIAELVEVTSSTGCFVGTVKKNSGYLDGDKKSTDSHGTPVSVMTKPGKRDATQTCMFKDLRTGATDIPMKNSGYKVVRDVIDHPTTAGKLQITTSKDGSAVTANGVASGAGVGNISKPQDV